MRLSALLLILGVGVFLAGCDWLFGTEPEEQPPGFGAPGPVAGPADARDAAIEYVNRTDPSANLPTDVEWAEEDITPTGLVGFSIFRYTVAGPSTMEWEIVVRFPVVPEPDYKVEIQNIVRGGYWQVRVGYDGRVEPIPFVELKGVVVAEAVGTRSESWGIEVDEGPVEYVGQRVGLRSYTEMKPALEGLLGRRIEVTVNKVCRSFDEAEGCCACAFDYCAPLIVEWHPTERDGS